MSIIVDALERVQTDRHIHSTNESLPVLDESASVPRPQKKSAIKQAIIFIVFASAAGGFILALNDEKIETSYAEIQNIPSSSTEEKTTDEFTQKIENSTAEFKQFEDEFFSTDEPSNTTESAAQEILPIELATEDIEDFKENFSLEIPKEDDIGAVKKEPTPPQIEAMIEKISMPTSPPAWLTFGIQTFHEKNLESAIPIWNKGFSSLKPETLIISVMINHVPELARKILDKLHNNQIDAFSVKGLFRKKSAYFTIVLMPTDTNLTLVEHIENLTKNKPFKTTQRSIKAHIDQLDRHKKMNANRTQSENTNTIPKQKKTISSKKLSNAERLDIAKNGVINGNYKQAIKTLRPVLFNAQTNWEVLFWVGSAKLGLGLFNEADDYFKKALTLNSEIPQLWTQRAIIAQEKDDHTRALKFLRKAKTLTPNAPEVILNIAYSNDALGDKNGAVFAYREFLSLTRGNGAFTQQRQAVSFRLDELGF